jgi:hypothetical protein
MNNRLPDKIENSDLVKELLPEAVQLLTKDLIQCGFRSTDCAFSDQDVFELRAELESVLLRYNQETIFNLLYRVDVSENKLKNNTEIPFGLQAAELIIIRELQKAYWRKKMG